MQRDAHSLALKKLKPARGRLKQSLSSFHLSSATRNNKVTVKDSSIDGGKSVCPLPRARGQELLFENKGKDLKEKNEDSGESPSRDYTFELI